VTEVTESSALPEMPPQAVVFDLDGTLVDSAPDILTACNAMLAALDRPGITLAQVRRFVGDGMVRLVERCLDASDGEVGSATLAQALGLFRVHYLGCLAEETRPYDHVVPVLERLSAEGIPLGICTNKGEQPARALLAALDLARHFRVVVGGDTLAVIKPDPAPLRHAIERLGTIPRRAVLVGDSRADETCARRAGTVFAFHVGGYRREPAESFAPAFAFADFRALDAWLLPGGRMPEGT
jgi:phosphoglycolate phosphatase